MWRAKATKYPVVTQSLLCEQFFRKDNPLWCSLNRTSNQRDWVKEKPHCHTETQEVAVGTLRSSSYDEVITVGLGHGFVALTPEIFVVAGIMCPKFSFCLVLTRSC